MAHKETLTEKLTGHYLPFVIWGIGATMLLWVYVIGDYVLGTN